MIVAAMTTEEVYGEVIRDFQSIQQKSLEAGSIFLWEMRRKKISVASHTISIKTRQLNEWKISFHLNYNQFDKTEYLKTRDKIGSVAYMVDFGNDNGDQFVVKLNSHFFQRYNERLRLQFQESSKIIKHFFKYNTKPRVGESGLLEDGTRYINYLFNKGLGIGWHEDDSKTTHLKTFISHDTLTRQQKAIADVLKNNEAQDVDIRIPEIHLKNKMS